MNKNTIFTEAGFLNAIGKGLVSNVEKELDSLLHTNAVKDMSINELNILQSNLSKLIGDKINNEIVRKIQDEKKLTEMSDEDFEEFLKEKYPNISFLDLHLTKEEENRYSVILTKRIQKAIKEGALNKEKYLSTKNYNIDLSFK